VSWGVSTNDRTSGSMGRGDGGGMSLSDVQWWWHLREAADIKSKGSSTISATKVQRTRRGIRVMRVMRHRVSGRSRPAKDSVPPSAATWWLRG